MSFWDEVCENDKKGLFTSDDDIVSYNTGITALDYANGFWNETVDENGNKIEVPVTGIQGGSLISIISETGGGKALPDSTLIPTPNGYRIFSTLCYGDKVFNRHGKPVSIIGIFPQGKKDIYELLFSTFNDKNKVVREAKCCIDHLWTVFDNEDNLITMPLREMISPDKDIDNADSDDNLIDISTDYCIPINQPVMFESKKVPLDPWAVGVLLGTLDCTSQKYLNINCKDEDVIKKLEMKLNCVSEPVLSSEENTYRFRKEDTDKLLTCDEVFKYFTKFFHNDYNESVIPYLYRYNDVETRINVLAGLLDSCGSISKFTHKIILKVKTIANMVEVFDLCQSLGFITCIGKKKDGIFTIEIKCHKKYAPYLFTVGKKHSTAIKFSKSKFFNEKYVDRLRISSIRKIGTKTPMRCIVVDDPEHLFLTEDYVVTHNSTLAIQMGWNIVKNFEDGLLEIIDCEKTNLRQRICNLTKTDYNEPRIRLNKSHTSIEDVLMMFNKMCDLKEASGKRYMYEVKSGARSSWHYVPTVFIIDSLPAFNSAEYNVEDLGSNTDQMRASKDISRFYNNVLDRAWKYNFIFIVINHIRPNTVMNPYAQPPRGLMMINSQTETLPRGSVAQYYSNTYFRIKTKKSSAYKVADEGFSGYKCEISLAKSKTNMVGTSFPVTFNTEIGFDPYYSIYEFALAQDLVQGRNPYLSIKGFEERKFNRKEFRNLMMADKEFREGVLRVLKPYYEKLLGPKKSFNEKGEELEAPVDVDIDLNSY